MKAFCRDCLTPFADAPSRCRSCASPRMIAHPEIAQLTIAHVDCDAFYASVEKRDRPELRDKPVIVGGQVRGVVTTACYIARLSGVRSAMPMFKARRLCPDAVIISPNFRKYRAASEAIFDRVRSLTPLVQSLSLDEAWLDLAGSQRLHGAPPAITLARLQDQIEREVGVTVSIGLAANRFLAKIASDLDKPRGFAVIGAAEARRFLAPRPVTLLPGVGPAFGRSLQSAGFRSIGDIAAADPARLEKAFGAHGAHLARLSRGEDARAVNPGAERKSLSAETTFEENLTRLGDLEDRLWPLCEKVARQARLEAIAGRSIVLKLRAADFRLVTRRHTASSPVQTAAALFSQARALLKTEADGRAWRLIGVGLLNLVDIGAEGVELFPGSETRARHSEAAVDALRARFGAEAVVRGRELGPRSPR